MPRPNFEAEMAARINAIRERNAAVMRESVQRVIEIAQTPVKAGGNLPVTTGFLRSTLLVTTAQNPPPPRERPESEARTYAYDGSAVALAILSWDFQRPLRAAEQWRRLAEASLDVNKCQHFSAPRAGVS